MPDRTRNGFLVFSKELFVNLPVLFVLYTAFHLMISSITWLSPPRPEWAWTIAFPLFWVFSFVWVRIYINDDLPNKNGIFYVFISMLAAGFVAVFILAEPAGLTMDQIIFQHEHTTYFWVALLMLHCIVIYGVEGFIKFFVIGLLYGALLESSGIQLGFFFEPDYHWYAPEILRPIFRAPVTTILGWTTVFYPTYFITEKIFDKIGVSNKLIRAVNASLVALSIDLQVDPVASEVGLWRWNEKLHPGFLGVPTLNFVSWFWAVIPFAYMVFYVTGRTEWTMRKRIIVLLISVPVCQTLAGAATFATLFLLEGAGSPALGILFEGIRTQLGLGG